MYWEQQCLRHWDIIQYQKVMLGSGWTEGGVLSPKESEERQQRAATLRKIDGEIDQILLLNSKHNSQYKQFIDKILFIEEHYKRENAELHTALHSANQKYASLEAVYHSLKDELHAAYARVELTERDNQLLRTEISKLKTMVQNQEGLIVEYRSSIEEEVALERQFLKSELEEQKNQLELQFSRVITQMENKYQEKVKKASREFQLRDFRQEQRELKRLVSSKNLQQRIGRSREKSKPLLSEYSTTDQENRHQQPVFLL